MPQFLQIKRFCKFLAISLIVNFSLLSSNFAASSPQRVALLLPLSGNLAGPGMAVKDGFMKASSHSKHKTEPLIYDTNKADVTILYQQALEDGAEIVIGPLTKADAAKIAELPHPVPTVLLNYLGPLNTENLYQFGLSPSFEAEQVANKAHQNGLRRALIIAPQGDWAKEIVSAFRTQWEYNHGQVVDSLLYQNTGNLNLSVRDFMGITDSNLRAKSLKQILGPNIVSVERRRQDFDMIFLLASPNQARQLMPLLKYYYAQDVPVYATSSVYSGSPNPMRDKDLNDIVFCDMPSVLSKPMADKHWPEQWNSYNRLYALGMDSFALTRKLDELAMTPEAVYPAETGILRLNSNQQINAVLSWGKFKQGVAERLKA